MAIFFSVINLFSPLIGSHNNSSWYSYVRFCAWVIAREVKPRKAFNISLCSNSKIPPLRASFCFRNNFLNKKNIHFLPLTRPPQNGPLSICCNRRIQNNCVRYRDIGFFFDFFEKTLFLPISR